MADILSQTNPLLQDYIGKSRMATSTAAGATTLADELKKTLEAKLSASPIVGERSQAAGNFLQELGNAPQTVTQQGTGGLILSPIEQANLISKRRAGSLMPLISANQQYDLLSGNLSDIVGQAGNAAKAQATSAQGEATLSGDIYKTVLDSLLKQEELNIKKSAATQKSSTQIQKQVDAQNSINLALARLQAARKSTVSGSSGIWPGILNTKQNLIGGGLPEKTSALRGALANLNKAVFDTAGKALTKGEAEMLAGTIGKVKDNPQVLNQIYDSIEQDLMSRKALLDAGLYVNPEWGLGSSTTTSTSGDWEIIQ